jgi:ATP-binding cassette, subfamily B, bacterial PglK
VPQAVFLLDDTLRRNVALGVPDAEIDETRLRAAIRRAQLEAFVAALPAGLETVVGERGARLSGAERQRIGVARALYHEPRLLVFGEATSALDGRTEAALIEALDASRGETTVLIVAHRLTSVRHCDRLVLLQAQRSGGLHASSDSSCSSRSACSIHTATKSPPPGGSSDGWMRRILTARRGSAR